MLFFRPPQTHASKLPSTAARTEVKSKMGSKNSLCRPAMTVWAPPVRGTPENRQLGRRSGLAERIGWSSFPDWVQSWTGSFVHGVRLTPGGSGRGGECGKSGLRAPQIRRSGSSSDTSIEGVTVWRRCLQADVSADAFVVDFSIGGAAGGAGCLRPLDLLVCLVVGGGFC